MANFIFLSASLTLLLPVLVPRAEGCQVVIIGGGCPDVQKCQQRCAPCYKGIGRVVAFCRPAGGGLLYDQCICSFIKGAPCNPPGCPLPPPSSLPLPASNTTSSSN